MLSRISISLRFRVDGRKRFENARYGYVFFFKKRGEKISVFKNILYFWTIPQREVAWENSRHFASRNVGSFLKRRKKRRHWFTTLLPACSNIIIEEFIYDKKFNRHEISIYRPKDTLEVVRIILILLIFEWLIFGRPWSRVSQVLDADFFFNKKARKFVGVSCCCCCCFFFTRCGVFVSNVHTRWMWSYAVKVE